MKNPSPRLALASFHTCHCFRKTPPSPKAMQIRAVTTTPQAGLTPHGKPHGAIVVVPRDVSSRCLRVSLKAHLGLSLGVAQLCHPPLTPKKRAECDGSIGLGMFPMCDAQNCVIPTPRLTAGATRARCRECFLKRLCGSVFFVAVVWWCFLRQQRC